jgi:hypothetical protein
MLLAALGLFMVTLGVEAMVPSLAFCAGANRCG